MTACVLLGGALIWSFLIDPELSVVDGAIPPTPPAIVESTGSANTE